MLMERNSYKVIKKINEGSFGEIFQVRGSAMNDYFALKHITFFGNVSDQKYIMNEISALSNLKHENIILLHTVIVKHQEVNIFMEFADNGNLMDYVSYQKKVENTTIFNIFIQILKGVNYCHEQFIAHKDLTPSNVLLTCNMTVKLADFGLSMPCRTSDGKHLLCNDFLGNKLYLAPEVIRQCVHDAMLADVWSIGVLLYFILFSCVPFRGDDDEILIQQQTISNYLLKVRAESLVPELFINTILKLLKITSTDRMNISSALQSWQICKLISTGNF